MTSPKLGASTNLPSLQLLPRVFCHSDRSQLTATLKSCEDFTYYSDRDRSQLTIESMKQNSQMEILWLKTMLCESKYSSARLGSA